MEGFTPGFFDRLLGTPVRGAGNATASRMTAEEFKDAVARDLEALLNTRSVIPENSLQGFPECSNSLVTYGLTDFADRSLSSPSDRAYICECLEKTIERHEPRLRKVKAMLEVRDDNAVSRPKFSITALLVVSTFEEPVNFDVTERLLVATEAGRNLYSSLGWQHVAPWATAVLPAMRCRSRS